MKLTKTAFLASAALLCAACNTSTSSTFKTKVTMGSSAQSLGGYLRYQNTQYATVPFKFVGFKEAITLKASDFKVTRNDTEYSGQYFVLDTDKEYPAVVTKAEESIKFNTDSFIVMFDEKVDAYLAKNIKGTVMGTAVEQSVQTDITIKY